MFENPYQAQEIITKREIKAIQIPSGDEISLPPNTKAYVTQKLGGSYTLATDNGLVRVSEENADGLGFKENTVAEDKLKKAQELADEGKLEEAVWERLKDVYDPEIPVNIVDLGLVYDCQIEKSNEDKAKALIKMTLTAPGCGMGPSIAADAQARVTSLTTFDQAEVELVWDPPWTQEMMSEEAKMKLGMI